MDQVHHVHQRPGYPDDVRIRQELVHEIEELPEGVHLEEPRKAQDHEFRTQEEVEQV